MELRVGHPLEGVNRRERTLVKYSNVDSVGANPFVQAQRNLRPPSPLARVNGHEKLTPFGHQELTHLAAVAEALTARARLTSVRAFHRGGPGCARPTEAARLGTVNAK